MSDRPPIAVTQRRKFCSPDEHPLLAVNPGLAVSDALELASTLLGGATRLLMNASDPDDTSVAQHLLETSKALMDASLTGIWNKEDAGRDAQ